MVNTVEWLLGVLLVFIYSRGRFRTPKTNVASTTVFRYQLASWSYQGATLLLFYFLAALLESSPEIIAAMGVGGPGMPSEVSALTGPLLAALLLTTLLPNFPVLNRIDQWLLEVFHDMGNIPGEVRLWRDRLTESEPQIPEDAHEKLAHLMDSDPRFAVFTKDDLRFEADDSPRYHFTKILHFMTVIDGFRLNRSYQRILEDFSEEYGTIRRRFEHAVATAVRCFQATDAQDPDDVAHAATASIVECKLAFRERCDELYGEMCQLIARGVLRCEASRKARLAKLTSFGFPQVERPEGPLSINQVVTIVGMVFVILFSVITILGGRSDDVDLKRGIYIAAMVAVIYGAAVSCAILPKTKWSFAKYDFTGDRPAVAYLISGIMAALAATLVSILFRSLYFMDFYRAIVDFGWSYPWLMMSFAVGLGVAALADNWADRPEPKWGRWLEGLVLAIVLAGLAWIVAEAISSIPGVPPRKVPKAEMTIPMSVAIGFVIGVFVPHWYRKRARKAEVASAAPVDT